MLWRTKYDLVFPMPASDIYHRYIRLKQRDSKWQDLSGFNKRTISMNRDSMLALRIDRQNGSFIACISDTSLHVYSVQGELVLSENLASLSRCVDIFHQISESKLLIAAGCVDG